MLNRGRGTWGVQWASNPEKRFRLSPSAPKFSRVSPIGWASDRQSDQQSSILCIRSISVQVRFNAGVAQAEERRSRKAEVGVSIIPSGSKLQLGESSNGRTAGLQPADEGSIPSSSTIIRQ